MKCKYEQYYKCDNDVEEGSEYCAEHKDKKCCSCGKQATHGCSYCGQFVCGFPLCDDCVGYNKKDVYSVWGFAGHDHRKRNAEVKDEKA